MQEGLDELPVLDELPAKLPDFNAEGVLAQGDFAPATQEFEERFVESPRRSEIYQGWKEHRQALMRDGLEPQSRQLVNGSFTTAKGLPGDVDIAVEVPYASSQPPPPPDAPILRLLLGRRMKVKFDCDAYPIIALPADHPDYQRVTVAAVRYWSKWFGRSRSGQPKGRVWTQTGGLR